MRQPTPEFCRESLCYRLSKNLVRKFDLAYCIIHLIPNSFTTLTISDDEYAIQIFKLRRMNRKQDAICKIYYLLTLLVSWKNTTRNSIACWATGRTSEKSSFHSRLGQWNSFAFNGSRLVLAPPPHKPHNVRCLPGVKTVRECSWPL